MGVVEETVADRIGEVGIADAGVTVLGRQLAGDEGGDALGAVLDHLDQAASLRVEKGSEEPVVDRKKSSRARRWYGSGTG